ncbi:hypothetical protein JVU11DRAFT_7274 [Chiua virens]|nr:hypothetical protein JVU11DRAFT_7274 [Chiua virens]
MELARFRCLFQRTNKRKCGVHNSHSSLSIDDQFGNGENEPAITYKSKRSVDHIANTNWAGAILEVLGVGQDLGPLAATSPAKRSRMENDMTTCGAQGTTATREDGTATTQTMPMVDRHSDSEVLTVRMQRLEHKINRGPLAVLDRVDGIQDTLCAQIQPSPQPRLHRLSSQGLLQLSPQALSPFSATNPTPEFLSIAHLDFPHTEFPFDIRHVPDPPAIHFSNDIDRLFREWESSALLATNGHGIPVKHWSQFYKKAAGAKKTAWDAL